MSPKLGPERGRTLRSLGALSAVGLSFVFAVIIGAALGYVLDRWLGSAPWLMLVGLLLGIASGFVNLFRAAGIFDREGEQAERDRDRSD